ncbi:Transcriptional regulator, IclR family [hydrothermal vent metagenome]|uniref:Transcriptional regulator, IclR family n=1 Tax=hydrothermal vent metagenome TaxID=652676 RepID=A0A3B0S3B9_9ZZZZ
MASVTKAFTILTCVSGAGGSGLPFAEIVRQTDLPKASTHRLLKEMVEVGALTFDIPTKCYRCGLLLARLGAGVIGTYDIRSRVRPYLEALQKASGQVATLGILNGAEGVYIDKVETSDFGIRLHSEIGKAFPLHATAMGKVLLAFDDEAVFSNKLTAYTDKTITSRAQLKTICKEIRKQGFAIDNEEITRGLVCIAAPVYGADGKCAGAISCTSPTYILDDNSVDAIKSAVIKQAAKASI